MTDTLILLEEIERPKKIFPNTLQKLARHFWHSEQSKNIIKFADTLETLPNVEVVCMPGISGIQSKTKILSNSLIHWKLFPM